MWEVNFIVKIRFYRNRTLVKTFIFQRIGSSEVDQTNFHYLYGGLKSWGVWNLPAWRQGRDDYMGPINVTNLGTFSSCSTTVYPFPLPSSQKHIPENHGLITHYLQMYSSAQEDEATKQEHYHAMPCWTQCHQAEAVLLLTSN